MSLQMVHTYIDHARPITFDWDIILLFSSV